MGQRTYKRKSNGQFAGGGAQGTKVTMGRAGGFANAGHQQRVRSARSQARHKAIVRSRIITGATIVAPMIVAHGLPRVIDMVGNRVTPARLNKARSNRLLKTTNRNKAAENHYMKRLPTSAIIIKAAVNGVHQATQVL